MPIIDITLLEGRDLPTKKRLMAEITDLVQAPLDVPRASIRVLVRELPKSHYAVGGVPKDELDGDMPRAERGLNPKVLPACPVARALRQEFEGR